MRLRRFRYGDRIATGASDLGSDTIRVLRGTFFEDPLPTGEEVPLDDARLLAPVLRSEGVAVGKNAAAHARGIRARGRQAKAFAGPSPRGPGIQPEPDPGDVRIEPRVNGETKQFASTSDMVFG